MDFVLVAYFVYWTVTLVAIERIMGTFFSKRRWSLPVTIASYAIYYTSGVVLFLTIQMPILNMVSSIVFLFLISMNYVSPIYKRFVATFGTFAIMLAVEGAFMVVRDAIGVEGDMFAQVDGIEALTVGDFLIMSVLVLVFSLIMRRFKKLRKNTVKSPLFWVASIIVPVGSIVLVIGITLHFPMVSGIINTIIVFVINVLIFIIHDAMSGAYEAQMKLQAQTSERMKVMLDSSPLACAIVNRDFKILEVNKQTARLFEIQDTSDFLNNPLLFSPERQADGSLSLQKSQELVKTAFRRGHVACEWLHITADGKAIPCELTLERVELEGEEVVIRYIHDLREVAALVAAKEQLENLAFTDWLTGFYNRRYFMNVAEKTFADCEKVSVIMMDIDFFKNINDTHGHAIGDEVIRIFGKRIDGVLGEGTVSARYGGEEFIVLLPNADKKAAEAVARRIHQNIVSTPFVIGDVTLPVTASLGVCTKSVDAKTITHLIDLADMAVYDSKTGGRNKVTIG